MTCCHYACARMLALNQLSGDSHIVLYTSLYKRQPENLVYIPAKPQVQLSSISTYKATESYAYPACLRKVANTEVIRSMGGLFQAQG